MKKKDIILKKFPWLSGIETFDNIKIKRIDQELLKETAYTYDCWGYAYDCEIKYEYYIITRDSVYRLPAKEIIENCGVHGFYKTIDKSISVLQTIVEKDINPDDILGIVKNFSHLEDGEREYRREKMTTLYLPMKNTEEFSRLIQEAREAIEKEVEKEIQEAKG